MVFGEERCGGRSIVAGKMAVVIAINYVGDGGREKVAEKFPTDDVGRGQKEGGLARQGVGNNVGRGVNVRETSLE